MNNKERTYSLTAASWIDLPAIAVPDGAIANVQNEAHHEPFDLVGYGSIKLVALSYGVCDRPCEHLGAGKRNWLAAHIHKDVVAFLRGQFHPFREMILNVQIVFGQNLFRQRCDQRGGAQARAPNLQNVRPVGQRESLRHLAAAGVADANK